ncbi:MAG: acyltransferase [Cytophaga sp.]|nr:acyltransferase [Undibacterium sp.]
MTEFAHSKSTAAHDAKYRSDIDGLRAIAVCLVILYHAWPTLVPGGYVGVDIFFVISGYLITKIIFAEMEQGSFSISNFYARRIRRIFPALLVVVAFTFCVGWLYLPVKEFKSLGLNVFGSTAFLQNFVLLKEVGYFDVAAAKKPLLHIWSLGIEEQYYILWPLVLWLVVRKNVNPLTAVVVLALLSFAFGAHVMHKNVDRAFYWPLARFWELMVGSGLAILVALQTTTHFYIPIKFRSQLDRAIHHILFHDDLPRRKYLLQDLGASVWLLILIVCAFKFNNHTPWPEPYALLPVLAATGLLVCKNSWVNRKILSSKAMVFVGLISYPLYLWHFPLIAFAHNFFPDGISNGLMCLLVIAGVVLAWLTKILIEEPVRFGRFRRSAITPLILGMLVCGGGGLYAFHTDGAPIRIPAELRKFMLTGDETAKYWRRGTCLMLPEQGKEFFAKECEGEGRRPLIMVWGDSYAASQYSGLEVLKQEFGFDVAEFTSSACAPLLGLNASGREFCKGNNDHVFQKIKTLRPDVLILHATWTQNTEQFEDGFAKTALAIKELGLKRVILLGPVPMWKEPGLSANVVDYYWKNHREIIPEMTSYSLVNQELEKVVKGLADRNGFEYMSVREVMCQDQRCYARVGVDGEYLTAFDSGHMTREGAVYLQRKLLPEILKGLR